MDDSLTASYALCQKIAWRSASSFYYSFLLLPRRKRESFCALYAFLRHTDDLGDDPAPVAARRESLARWRQSLEHAMDGQFDDPMFPALADTVQRFQIPLEYLHAAIDGVEMDLSPSRYRTFADLEVYCYGVAGVVGLACLKIWGCEEERASAPAVHCGTAFQLTNILRDLKEDVSAGRIYLPEEDFQRFKYSSDELQAGVCNQQFLRFMEFEIARAEEHYSRAAGLADLLAGDERRVFLSMMGVYQALLAQIKRAPREVLSHRISLSRLRKLRIAAGCMLRGDRQQMAKRTAAASGVEPR